ncbi:MAG: hypothetical protein GTO13_18170, partial [Proteobacteria bacterium]|nr:hypothetical protein [Pseudomonadota bacterium]
MKDVDKAKEQLIIELVELRQRIAELETLEGERKRAETQLIRAKQEWERTFDAVPDLIMILNNEYRVVR